MRFLPGNVYHVYNQGNNNQVVFEEEVHFNYFLQLYHSDFWSLIAEHLRGASCIPTFTL